MSKAHIMPTPAVAGNTNTISNELLYTGRRLDPETGLQLNRNRFYASHLGRWVNRDPIGYQGGDINLYGYVFDDPLGFVDPNGKAVGQKYNDLMGGGGAGGGGANWCKTCNWRTTSAHTQMSTRKGGRKSGCSIQTKQVNECTGEIRVIHTVFNDCGKIVDGPHFRPFFKPHIEDLLMD